MVPSLSIFFLIYAPGVILVCIGAREGPTWLIPVGLVMYILGALVLPLLHFRKRKVE